MMKIINKICTLLAIAALTVGCAEDKGNYTYHDINELKIDGVEEDTRNILDGELLEVTPTLTFINGTGNIERLKYKWILGNETQPDWNQLKFSWIAHGIRNNVKLRFEVHDPVTGITYIAGTQVSVVSRYNQDGLQILAEKNGETQFSFLRFTKTVIDDNGFNKIEKLDPFINVYAQENGEALPAGPVMIMEHFCNDNSTIGQMLLLTKGATVDANGMDYKKEVDLQQVFENGVYPQDFGYVSDAFGMSRVDLAADAEGHVYTRIKHTSMLFHSGEYLDHRLEINGEVVKGCKFVPAPFQTSYACMVYDSNKKRLFLINDTSSAGSGSLSSYNAGHPYLLAEPLSPPEGFVPINDMSGINPIWMGYYHTSTWGATGYTVIFERGGKTFCQQFDVTKAYGQCQYAVENPVINEIPGLPGIPTYAYGMPYENNPVVLLAIGNELWIYDRANPKLAAIKYDIDFPSPVVTMDAENYFSRLLGLALEDGTVYIVNAIKMSNPANAIVFYKSEESYGKVAHLCFKRRSSNSWDVNDD